MVVTWATVADVATMLGVPVATAGDDRWLSMCTAAANGWCFAARAVAGYADDPATSPGDDVTMGVTLYGAALYRERGAVDGFASFSELGQPIEPTAAGTMGQVRRLLHIGKPATDVPVCLLIDDDPEPAPDV